VQSVYKAYVTGVRRWCWSDLRHVYIINLKHDWNNRTSKKTTYLTSPCMVGSSTLGPIVYVMSETPHVFQHYLQVKTEFSTGCYNNNFDTM